MSVDGVTSSAMPTAPQDAPPAPDAVETAPAAVPEKVEEAPKDDRFAAKFAALTRKEKETKAREKQLAEREAAIAKRSAELEAKANDKTWEQELKANPLKFMEKYNITFEQLTDMQLNDQNPTPDMKMQRMREELKSETQKELEVLRKQLAEKEEREAAQEQEAATRQYEQVKTNFINQIKSEVQANVDAYELVSLNGDAGVNLVFEVMEEYYNSTAEKDESGAIIKPGKVLSVQEALKHVEEHFEEQAKPLLKLKKFQQTSAPQPKQPSEGKQTAPTLSNTLSADVPVNGRTKMSKEEALELAIKQLRFTED